MPPSNPCSPEVAPEVNRDYDKSVQFTTACFHISMFCSSLFVFALVNILVSERIG